MTLQEEVGEKGDPVKVFDKLEAYVRPGKNKRIVRHKLKLRKQIKVESLDNFVKDLRLILVDCAYADPYDIRIDSIIDEVHAKKLEERLFVRGEEP